MKTSFSGAVLLVLAFLAFSCQPQPTVLTDAQKAAVADSVKILVQDAFAGAQELSGADFLHPYSSDPDVRYVENGVLYPSLDTVRVIGDMVYGMLESLTNQIDAFDIVVLAPDAAVVTVPFRFTIKTKAGKEISSQGVYSAVAQRRSGMWQIVQSHESWRNVAEVMAALMPPQLKK